MPVTAVLRTCSECQRTRLTRHYGDLCEACYKRQRYWTVPEVRAAALRKSSYRRKARITCRYCGADLGPKKDNKGGAWSCSDCARERRRASNRRKNVKRRGAVRSGVRFTVRDIAERDGWRCHLCRRSVNRRLPGTDLRGPTIDHLIPLSAGGRDEPSNVALAHRSCNSARRDRGAAQLRLVG